MLYINVQAFQNTELGVFSLIEKKLLCVFLSTRRVLTRWVEKCLQKNYIGMVFAVRALYWLVHIFLTESSMFYIIIRNHPQQNKNWPYQRSVYIIHGSGVHHVCWSYVLSVCRSWHQCSHTSRKWAAQIRIWLVSI